MICCSLFVRCTWYTSLPKVLPHGVCLAGLCAARRLLILDEPVTGLDPAAAQDLYRTLAYLNKNEGLAIVMVTHDLQNALQYADTVLYAGQGKWFHGTTAEYLASPYGRRFGGERT